MPSLSWRNVIVSGMGVLTDGYNLYSIALTSFFISSSFSFSKVELGLLVAGSYYGAALAALVFGLFADRLGRKSLYGLDVAIMAVGAGLQGLSQSYLELFLARLILGVGIGADYVLSPVIVAENAEGKNRGKMMVITFAVMWGLGAVIAAFVEQVTLALGLPNSLVWRIVLSAGALPALSVFYLRRRIYETLLFISRVRPEHRDVEKIERELGRPIPKKRDEVSFLKRLTSSALFIVAASILWLLYDMYSSTFAIYGPITIASNLGISPIMFTYVAQFLAGIPGQLICISLIDRIGRKPLIILGYAGVAVWLMAYSLLLVDPRVFGLSATSLSSSSLVGEAALLGFTFYLLNYLFSAIGPASIIGSAMIAPELTPTKVRATGQAITVSVDRLATALNITAFPLLLSHYGLAALVGFYAMIALVSSLITLLVIPETKGKELEIPLFQKGS
ncbi:arabinose efflux permease family protein [Metallosphaera yellowstonensis MK1]|uniref:Arabinose efflux permease family protein n=1 Tax=Metallosphaera yellowstonensis MK1 TaxID=671065 RepID=H2C5E6_9CREN|nr:MFS transporter [Metallosphaera yellowstonensis]EHP69023.1 arabinose efflux permease family protein [Metallosphaera yellowstonensis MK1]